MAFAQNPYQQPHSGGISVINAPDAQRSSFLRKTALWTGGGLAIAGAGAISMSMALLAVPFLSQRFVMIGIVFGGIFAVRGLETMVNNAQSTASKAGFFAAGQFIEGITMGYIIFAAAMMGIAQYGNPLAFIGQAIALVGLTVAGLCAYLMTGPKNLSMIGGTLSAVSLPLMLAVGLTWIFPVGGMIGMAINVVLIGVSAAGLLYNLNHVIHNARTDMHIESAYHISIGVLVLLWNVLTLIMSLQSRD